MKTRTWKIGALLAGFINLVCQVDLGAQTLTLPYNLPLSNTSVTFGIDPYGVLFETGPLGTATTYMFSGSNPQLLWLPAFSAFRAGTFSGTQTIGQYSFAFGNSSVASALGSIAFSGGTASGASSFAMGPVTASGGLSYARGIYSTASGTFSTAIGAQANAIGTSSTVLGSGSATANNSTVLGAGTANGNYSTATGFGATANSYSCFTIGQYNVSLNESLGTSSLTSWLSTDPVLEIGNGVSPVSRSDALVVYKNGDAVFSPPAGTATCTVTAPVFVTSKVGGSGDIPMYAGGN